MTGEHVSAEGELVRELRQSVETDEAKRAMAQRELEAMQRVLDETTRQRDLSLATLRHNGLDIDHDGRAQSLPSCILLLLSLSLSLSLTHSLSLSLTHSLSLSLSLITVL